MKDKKQRLRDEARRKSSIRRLALMILTIAVMISTMAVIGVLFSPRISAAVGKNEKNKYDFTGIYFRRESAVIKVGGTYELNRSGDTNKMRFINVNSSIEGLTFVSSNAAVATVSESGVITAVKAGEATVTATKTVGEKSYTATIKVVVTEVDPLVLEYNHRTELVRDFLDLRFGAFFHFNSATVEVNLPGYKAKGVDEWDRTWTNTFFDPATDWDPSDLDCNQWITSVKAGGATFACLTTKHHAGFDLWDSAYTDWDVGSAKNKTDVVKAFVDACNANGVKPGLYFSIFDIKNQIEGTVTASDVEFIKGQIRELLTNYGELAFLMFDGWGSSWAGPSFDKLEYEEIASLIHTLQPNCLVVSITSEPNNVHADVTIIEEGAGENLPQWFDNVNMLCNTPSNHWFWFDSYNTNPITKGGSSGTNITGAVNWAINDHIKKFENTNTVVIINASPNQKGVLVPGFVKYFEEIGKQYKKQADVSDIPTYFKSQYDYTQNLLFHKDAYQSGTENPKISASRAVDGYTDYEYSHQTTSKVTSGSASNCWWSSDIGYSAELGKFTVYVGNEGRDMKNGNYYLAVSNSFPSNRSYTSLSGNGNVTLFPLSEATKNGDAYTVDLGGIAGRYIVLVSKTKDSFNIAEIIVSPKNASDAAFYTRNKGDVISASVPAGVANPAAYLPATYNFVCANGEYKSTAVTWDTSKINTSVNGIYTITGSVTGSSYKITANVSVQAFTRVPHTKVTASSMWSESSSWANSQNLLGLSGLTINPTNFLLSTMANTYNCDGDMWHSGGGVSGEWLVFGFDGVQTITNLAVWNHNQNDSSNGGQQSGRGIKDLEIWYTNSSTASATSDTGWTKINDYTFHRASGQPTQTATDFITFGKIEATQVKFKIKSNFQGSSPVGLAKAVFMNYSGSADVLSLASLTEQFTTLSKYNYVTQTDSTKWDAAKSAYIAALAVISKIAPTSGEVSTAVTNLQSAINALPTSNGRNPSSLVLTQTLELKAGAVLPDTFDLQMGSGASYKFTVNIVWETDVAALLLSGAKGGTVKGYIPDTPYAVSLSYVSAVPSKAALNARINDYNSIATAKYTAASAGAFTTALNAAKALVSKADATQTEIDTAVHALNAAKYALVISYSGENTTDPDDSSNTAPEETTPDSTPEETAPDATTPGSTAADTTAADTTSSGTTAPNNDNGGGCKKKKNAQAATFGNSLAAFAPFVAAMGGVVSLRIIRKRKADKNNDEK